jgi:Ca-activated chloride channel family protein
MVHYIAEYTYCMLLQHAEHCFHHHMLLTPWLSRSVGLSLSVCPLLQGSYEIHSYCLGHTKFVTSATSVPPQAAAAGDGSNTQQQQQHLVISGSGDGTIRLWDVDTGKQVASYVASEQPPPLAFQKQQEEAGGAPEGEQEQEGQEGQEGQDEDAAAAASRSEIEEDQQQQQQEEGQEQQEEQQQQGSSKEAGDSTQQQSKAVGSKGFIAQQGGRYHKAREACCAVVSIAVSPDGATIAAAVEGQQELQLLSLDRTTGEMQLQHKLAFPDVVNPAAVAFDSTGRLWAVGGVLVRETESAHVGVAAKAEGKYQCCLYRAAAAASVAALSALHMCQIVGLL